MLTTGNQTIAGVKTFSNNLTVGGNSLTAGSLDVNGNADISGNLTGGNTGYKWMVFKFNMTNDKTFTNYQFLIDFAWLPPGVNRVATAGLPDKRYVGLKATYSF